MTIKIEKGIPVPERKSGNFGRKYPFSDMDVGDSIYIPKPLGRFSAHHEFRKAKQPEWIFTARKEGEGQRIWRIK